MISNKELSQPKDAQVDWSDRLEFISKISAAVLALTYVSGYLIATTYLSTFGISADSSDLLRAKYIYIGCLYWLFVTVIGVLGRAMSLFLGAIKASETLSEKEQIEARNILECDLLHRDELGHRWRPLRKWIVLSLVLVPFAVQIIFLDPNDIRAVICFQSILLLGISLYQTAFYREYSKDGYAWGSLYGKWYVERVKIGCGVVPGLLAAFFMAGIAASPWVFTQHDNEIVNLSLSLAVRPIYLKMGAFRSSWEFWIVGVVLVLLLCFGALFVTLSTENLQWLEKNGKAQRVQCSFIRRLGLFLRDCILLIDHAARVFFKPGNLKNQNGVKREWRTVFDCFGLPVSTGVYASLVLTVLHNDKSNWNARVVAFGTLILALIAISNVIIILMMRRELVVTLGLKEKSSKDRGLLHRSDPWFVRVLVVAVLYTVSVLGFAYRVYPFVPVQKAGGDYSTAEPVSILLMKSTECSSIGLSKEIEAPRPAVVLSEDSNWVYVAPLSGLGSGWGPKCWSWGPFCNSPASPPSTTNPSRPKVYTLSRHCIAGIVTASSESLTHAPSN